MVDLRATVETICSHAPRAPCSDAERRVALALHDDLRARGHEAWVETLWVRPQWHLSLALHAAVGVAASVVSTAQPAVALGLALLALVSYGLEAAGRGRLLQSLFFRRATQVVVVDAPDPDRVALVITARTDAPRQGLVFREGMRRLAALAARAGRHRLPGPLAWVLICMAAVAATSGARLAGLEGPVLGSIQFLPTLALLTAASAALDIALSTVSPGGSDAAAVAVALALHQELAERPPHNLSPALRLHGAGEGAPTAFAAQLRRERPDPGNTVVLEIGPVAAPPSYSRRAGVLLAMPVHPQLRIAGDAAELPSHVARRPSAAVAAMRRGIPAVAVTGLDDTGIPPRHRSAADACAAVTDDALAAALQACVALVDALDAELDVID